MSRYRVITRAVVERIYDVEAKDEKDAIAASTMSYPVEERDQDEETLSVLPFDLDAEECGNHSDGSPPR